MAQMLLDNLVQIAWLHESVPDLFGIDDDRRPVLALFQTAGFVHAERSGKSRRSNFVLQEGMQFALAIGAAGGPRRARFTLIGTDENVTIEFGQ
jgi:hypothetical protein